MEQGKPFYRLGKPTSHAGWSGEAEVAGQWLLANGSRIDAAYSSRLQQAKATLDILLDRTRHSNFPRYADWCLNERRYGVLQGMNKAEAAVKVGEQQVWRWRHGYEDKADPLLHPNWRW